MSDSTSARRGGLRLSGAMLFRRLSVAPLRDGADVSWLQRCIVGDDQGREGACSIFAIASWAEIVLGHPISDQACLVAYQDALSQLGRGDDGLTYEEATQAAVAAGFLPGTAALTPCVDLSFLDEQPLLAAYAVTAAWDRVSSQGCLDHSADAGIRGYHAVPIVAHGELRTQSGRWVYIENSWGLGWGWNGIGVMSEGLHRSLIREIWRIVI